MQRTINAIVCLVLAAGLVPTSLAAETVEQQVRKAALVTWVHGITQEIADREIGPEGVPTLLELLKDPDFPRRDNVVAFLGYLAWDSETTSLVDLLDDAAITDERPEDRRSRLLVPESLGRIAARGGALARAALDRIAGDASAADNPALTQMVDYGQRLASRGAADLQPAEPGDPPVNGTSAIDPSPFGHRLLLTHANHVDVDDPIADTEVDSLLESASVTIATENGASDTACCIQLLRSLPGASFGTPGDGLDVITTASELTSVISDSTARVKVVDVIGYCSGPGSNIIGCGNTPGNGMIVVRLSNSFTEGLLWAHEFGHNTGLGHNASSGFVMSPSLANNNTKVNDPECNQYHNPASQTNINPISIGSCHDDDGDGIVSSSDNCPLVSNVSQSNSDDDSLGNSCDNCIFADNQNQADCDGDAVGDACDLDSDVPDEPVENVEWKLASQVIWDPQPYLKRIYRGTLWLGSPWPFNEFAAATVTLDSWEEPTLPAPNQMLYYLVRAFNDCGEGP